MDIDREGLSRIKELLKNNPRGMNVTEIAREIGMNRLSVAKYLEMLVISGHLDVKAFGPSKVYFLSQRLPISAMLSLSSDFIVILDKDLRIINVNDKFLEFTNSKRSDILFQKLDKLSFPIEFRPSLIPSVTAALDGKNITSEAYFKKKENETFFNIKFIPLVFDDGQKGVTILFEDITDKKRIELAVKDSERKLRNIIEQSMDGITLTDEHGRIIEYNRGEEEIVGIAREKAIGMYIWDLQASLVKDMCNVPEFRERIKSSGQKILKTGEIPDIHKYVEREIDHPDGSKKTIHVMTFSIQTEKGFMVCGITRDITERNRVELKIRESETQFRAIFEQAAVGIAYVDENDRIKSTNKRFCDILGYEQGELVDLTYKDITHPEDIALTAEYLEQLKARKISSYSCEKRYFRKDGSIVWTNVTVSLLNTNDADNYHIVIIEDIMARKQAEEALRKAELHLAKAQRIAQVGSWEVVLKGPSPDLKNVDVQWSNEMYRILGLDSKSSTNRFSQFLDLVHPEDRDILIGVQNDLINNKRNNSVDIRIIARDGIEKILHTESSLETDDGGHITRLQGTAQDVTEHRRMEEVIRKARDELEKTVDERTLELKTTNEKLRVNNEELEKEIQGHKIAQEALHASEIRFRSLIQNSSDIIRILDRNRLIIYNSPSSEKLLGYPSGYMLGKSPVDFVHPDDLDRVRKDLGAVYDNKNIGTPIEYRIRKSDGEYLEVESVGMNMFGVPGVDGIVTTTRAITDRKRAEDVIRASEQKFRGLVENISDGVWETDNRLAFTYMSPKSFDMIGYMPEEMLGKTTYDFMNSEEVKRVKGSLYGIALEMKPFNLFECTLLHKDEHTVNVEISGDPIFSSSGDFIGYRGITRDVTQRNKDKYDLSVANRSLRLLSDCNRALIQSTNERELLTDICHILVETGEYRLAWVGYKGMDEEKRIIPVADAGNDTGYVETIKLSWSDESVGGMGPGGMAIRNGNPFILRWDGLKGQFEWWRKEALDRGINSIIGLPLMENGQAFGVLLIYSDRMDAFNDAEVELLKELSDNISYSVVAIRARSNH